MNNKKLNAVDAIRHAINVIQQQSQSIKADETLAVLSMLNKESQHIIEISKKLTALKTKVKTKVVHVPAAKKVPKPEPVKPPTVKPHTKPVSKHVIKPIKPSQPLKNKQPV